MAILTRRTRKNNFKTGTKKVRIKVRKKHKASCKKYKALISKYKPYILKYMACIFAVYKYVKKNVLQKPFSEAFRRGKMPYV